MLHPPLDLINVGYSPHVIFEKMPKSRKYQFRPREDGNRDVDQFIPLFLLDMFPLKALHQDKHFLSAL